MLYMLPKAGDLVPGDLVGEDVVSERRYVLVFVPIGDPLL